MKELPVLSSNFKYFSWSESVGNSTASQVQRAFESLTTETYRATVNFSRYVWNDMVDLLHKALTQAGLSWNSKFGTYKQTKMEFKYDILTAKMFNAMTTNLDQLFSMNWYWMIDTNSAEYVGRKDFYGITELKERGDFLYAGYILELVRVLNLFIAILKNEANFAEILPQDKIKTTTDTTVLSKVSAPFSPIGEIATNNYAQAIARETALLYIRGLVESKSYAELSGVPFKVFEGSSISKTIENTYLTALTLKNLPHKQILKSLSKVSAKNPDSAILKPSDEIVPTIYSGAVNNGQGVPIAYDDLVKIENEVSIISAVPKHLNIKNTSHTNDYVKVSNGVPRYAEVSNIIDSVNNIKATAHDSATYKPQAVSKTIDQVKVASIGMASGIFNGIIKMLHYVRLTVESEWSDPVLTGNNLYIRQAWFTEQDESNLNIDYMTWLYPVQEENNLYIKQVYDDVVVYENNAHIDTNGIWFEPVQTGTNLYIRQAESMEGSD